MRRASPLPGRAGSPTLDREIPARTAPTSVAARYASRGGTASGTPISASVRWAIANAAFAAGTPA
jgi:hypothetical protein